MSFQETFKLPFEMTNGNDGRGSKWFSSANVRKKFEAKLRRLGQTRKPFPHPVSLTIVRVLGKRQRLWDNDSIGRGNAKEIIDSLVACGWFHDDSPKFISRVDYRQDDSRKSTGPFVEITIKQE